jgi:hypothetical protein
MKCDINNILVIVIIIFIILMICLKCLDIQSKIQENFEDAQDPANEVDDAETLLETNDAISNMENNSGEDTSNSSNEDADAVENLTNQEKAELRKKCAALDDKPYGSIVSKYSGKTINVDHIGERDGDKLYIIKWQPLGGKPGGCITLEANGTYSTPLCNPNIDKQKWILRKITSEKILKDVIPKERQSMGRAMEETAFPFYMIVSSQDKNYVLNYEGGGLSIRLSANYDGQKWDVSEKKIAQDPLPTQKNSKFASLTPDHNMSDSDKSMGNLMSNRGLSNNNQGNGSGNSNDKGGVNLNVNLDPDLLAKLGLGLGSDGSLQNLNQSLNQNTNGNMEDDFFEKENSTGGSGNIDDMLEGGEGNPNCKNCDKIPDKYIKKDTVKSMCIGCDNIDNVLT